MTIEFHWRHPLRRKRVQPEDGGNPIMGWLGTVFCLGFAGLGLWLFSASLVPLFWKEVPCSVESFQPKDDRSADKPFTALVLFKFEWQGRVFTGDKLGVGPWQDSLGSYRLREKFRNTPLATCRLPEGDPARAVLVRPQIEWVGLIFGIVGGLFIFMICPLFEHRRGEFSIPMAAGALFISCGLVSAMQISLPAWYERIRSNGWVSTPAVIVWSTSQSHSSKNVITTSADICFQYEYGGQTWRSNRIKPGDLNMSDNFGGAKRQRANYRTGGKVVCYADPQDPAKAVLERNFGWFGLVTLFPAPFLGMGAWMILGARRKKRAI
jgi:hypothetical protein